MLECSWQLLSEPERIVLRRMAVHAEGCDLAAVEAVCGGDGLAAEDVLALLADLVDRSLVVSAPGGARPATSNSGPRYRLLETVVAYGMERLRDAGELEDMQRRYADYYVASWASAGASYRPATSLAASPRSPVTTTGRSACTATG
jgi:predicted ATPase